MSAAWLALFPGLPLAAGLMPMDGMVVVPIVALFAFGGLFASILTARWRDVAQGEPAGPGDEGSIDA